MATPTSDCTQLLFLLICVCSVKLIRQPINFIWSWSRSCGATTTAAFLVDHDNMKTHNLNGNRLYDFTGRHSSGVCFQCHSECSTFVEQTRKPIRISAWTNKRRSLHGRFQLVIESECAQTDGYIAALIQFIMTKFFRLNTRKHNSKYLLSNLLLLMNWIN